MNKLDDLKLKLYFNDKCYPWVYILKIENAKTDKANDRISFSYYKR